MAFASLVATSTRRVHIAIIVNGPSGLKTVSKIGTERGNTQTPAEQVFLEKLADCINVHLNLESFEASTSRLPGELQHEAPEDLRLFHE